MRFVVFFALSFALWLLLTFNLDIGNLIAGASVALVSTGLFGRYFVDHVAKFFEPVRYLWLIVYVFIFTWECVKANLDVAYRVLNPALPVKPGIVKVRMQVQSDIARTFLANSITMTPGTISVDIVDDDLFVHWIYVADRDPEKYTHRISGRFEKYIERIFE